MGGVTETWATQATVWAMVKPVGGRERAYRGGLEAQVDYRMIIRFAGDSSDVVWILSTGAWDDASVWADDGVWRDSAVVNSIAYSADDRVEYQGKTYGIEYVLDVEDRRTWLELGVRAAK